MDHTRTVTIRDVDPPVGSHRDCRGLVTVDDIGAAIVAHHRGAGLGIGRLGIGLPGLECGVETALRGTGNLPLEFSIEPQLDDLVTLHVRRVNKLLTTLIAEHQAVNTAELRGDGADHVAVR